VKILGVINTLAAAAGGTVEAMVQQAVGMAAQGHTVHTLALDAPGVVIDARLRADEVFLVGPPRLNYGYTPKLVPWLQRHGRDYDVIVVHGMWQYHGYAVAKVARSMGLRYVVFLHGMLDPWFARQYPLKHLKKWLYWPWGEYPVLAGARLVLFTAEDELRLARESFPLYAVRERMVGFGVRRREIAAPEARDAFLSAFPHLRGTRNLLFLSRIHPKKGCDLLIEAFSRVAMQDARLHLVLAGPDSVGWRAQLAARAEQLGLTGRITFTGMLAGAVKWGAYDASEVFVLPSHQENFGIVVAEALASGLPVLTTHKVNIWREIQNAGAGLVNEDTQAGVDRLLGDWLGLDAPRQQAIRDRALPCFEQCFELQQTTSQLLDALREAASDRPIAHTYRGRWSQRLLGATQAR
jgi:glycosyltransferase involved in cell wall biosynthesis